VWMNSDHAGHPDVGVALVTGQARTEQHQHRRMRFAAAGQHVFANLADQCTREVRSSRKLQFNPAQIVIK